MLNLLNRGNHLAICSLSMSAFVLCGLPKPLHFRFIPHENQPLPQPFHFNDAVLATEANYDDEPKQLLTIDFRRVRRLLADSLLSSSQYKYLLLTILLTNFKSL